MSNDLPDNIVGFTGPRNEPTIVDRQKLVDYFEKLKGMAQTGEIVGVAIVCAVPDDELPITEVLALPGASTFQLVGGLHILVVEMQMRIQMETMLEANLAPIIEALEKL